MPKYDHILNVAHRGGPIDRPENTFAAFDHAPNLGTNWIETDLRSSSDGEIVLIHDGTVDRTTDGTGAVNEMTVAQLKALDAGGWFDMAYAGQRIPTLPEFFERYRGKMKSMLEVKDPGHVEERLVSLMHSNDVLTETIIIGSNRESLEKVKSLDVHIQVGWTAFEPTDENIDGALAMGCHHIGLRSHLLTPEIVESIHARGLPVRSTNVPDEAAMRHVIECGVIGMTINFPEKLASYLGGLEADHH